MYFVKKFWSCAFVKPGPKIFLAMFSPVRFGPELLLREEEAEEELFVDGPELPAEKFAKRLFAIFAVLFLSMSMFMRFFFERFPETFIVLFIAVIIFFNSFTLKEFMDFVCLFLLMRLSFANM